MDHGNSHFQKELAQEVIILNLLVCHAFNFRLAKIKITPWFFPFESAIKPFQFNPIVYTPKKMPIIS
jgi:hypothetical protein